MCNMEKDDDTSSESDVSHISGLSDLSNHDWEPSSGTMSWVQQQVLCTNFLVLFSIFQSNSFL